jgi:hypothetical protein
MTWDGVSMDVPVYASPSTFLDAMLSADRSDIWDVTNLLSCKWPYAKTSRRSDNHEYPEAQNALQSSGFYCVESEAPPQCVEHWLHRTFHDNEVRDMWGRNSELWSLLLHGGAGHIKRLVFSVARLPVPHIDNEPVVRCRTARAPYIHQGS